MKKTLLFPSRNLEFSRAKNKRRLYWCYYRLNVCLPFKVICWNLTPMWWYLEVGLLRSNEVMRVDFIWTGLVFLQKRLLRAPLSLLICEDTARRQPSMNKEEGPHQAMVSAITLTLYFPAFITVRNKCLLVNPQSLWYFCYSSPNEPRQRH